MASLDKFYTKSEVAEQCVRTLNSNLVLDNPRFLEPSAGGGAFLPFLSKYEAYDIQPEHPQITKLDFLDFSSEYHNFVAIGNPPFGNRSKLAIEFFNKCAIYSDAIAFIVPVSFMKWSVQKELDKQFKLISLAYLEPNSFLDNGKEFKIRTVFQIWVKRESIYDSGQADIRLQKSPPISHPDLQIWQHNATLESRKYVEEDWEFATWRQGYKDYNSLFTREDYEELRDKVYNTNLQFFFIKPLTEEARKIVLSMDFNALAERNTTTPGFGKGDFVSYYLECKDKNDLLGDH